jgi:hypothetical protein
MTQAHPSKAQRRLLTAGGGLGVVALAGGAFVLSFDNLRALAIRGGASRHIAYLYPWMLDGLVVVVILSILMSRRFRWWSRAVRWLLLLALVAGAGAAAVEHAVRGYEHLPHMWVSGGVAVAPWVILMLAFWLWVSMIKQARRMRPDEPRPTQAAADTGLIPGLTNEPDEPRPPALRELEPVRPDDPRPVEPSHDTLERDHAPAVGDAEAERREPDPSQDDEPVREERAAADEPVPVASTLLPTDVALVGAASLNDTQPDGIKLPDTKPDGIPILGPADEADADTTDRAEDPDVLPEADPTSEESTEPPSSKFRSSPTPPRE